MDEDLPHHHEQRDGHQVRGSGLEVVYVQLLALGFIATLLVGFSAWRFRGQMS